MDKEIALDIRIKVNRQNPDIRMKIDKGSTPPEYYEGEYEFTPILYDEQVLDTAWKTMQENVIIHPITIQEVSNSKGGRTVTIGVI